MATAKKAAAKKAPAKKAAAKSADIKITTDEVTPDPVGNVEAVKDETPSPSVEAGVAGEGETTSFDPTLRLTTAEVAQMLHAGSRTWGTGRDRDTTLVNEGYDLDELREEMRKLRAGDSS